MVMINKAEKDAIAKKFPYVHIVRTMRQKSKRHRYYCEEAKPAMRYLEQLRNPEKVEKGKKGGARNNGRKKSKRVRA